MISARINDIFVGVCMCHAPPIPMTGKIIIGSPDAGSANFAQSRVTDIVQGECGHVGKIVTGAPSTNLNVLPKSRVGSLVVGCLIGQIVTGSPKHEIGDAIGSPPSSPSTTITFQGQSITFTEVDYGGLDDNPDSDDGLNIFPGIPTINGVRQREPTPQEIAHSEEIAVPEPTFVEQNDTTSSEIEPVETDCESLTSVPSNDYILTPNFTLGSVSKQTVLSKNTVMAQAGLTINDIICNLKGWCENIGEPLAAQYGRNNFIITSGFRYGSGSSQHERGQATDIQFPGMTNTQVYNIAIWIRDNLNVDQIILEYGNRPWIHSSFNRAGNRPSSASNKFGTRTKPGNYVWGKFLNMI